MCCCFVTQCCCGCTSLKVGVMVWAIIDALVNLFMIIFAVTTAGAKLVNWWGILVLVVDFVLAIGAHLENTGLMLVWQIVMMINIVILFIMWLVIPFVVNYTLSTKINICLSKVAKTVNLNFGA